MAFAAEGTGIAVFPPTDRTGRAVPVERIQDALEASLASHGFSPLPRAALDDFLTKHRVRYMGGVPEDLAVALGEETKVAGVLLSSVDDWEEDAPPRFALTARYVVAAPGATVAWMETIAGHGDENPGAFGLGLIEGIDPLIGRAAWDLSVSLAAAGESSKPARPDRAPRRFRPGTVSIDSQWAAAAAGAGRPLRVAVLPFVVDASRRDVGEIVALQFVRWLLKIENLLVLEPGVVRGALLEARVIQEDGPSLPQVDALRALLDVDLVVSGRVTDYEAMGSSPGTPYLGFSASGIDSRTRQAVWSSFSFGRGDDRMGPFGAARLRSSITLASGLVQGAVETLGNELASRRSKRDAAGKEQPR